MEIRTAGLGNSVGKDIKFDGKLYNPKSPRAMGILFVDIGVDIMLKCFR